VPSPAEPPGYDALYAAFDTPLARRLRREAYGEDIGQHSWVTAGELRRDMARLGLSPAIRLVDLGCGPAGPLTFVAGSTGCRAVGLERSRPAIAAGRARIASLGLAEQVRLVAADLDHSIPLAAGSCQAATSFDVVLHLSDRGALYRDVARVLAPRGRFLFTDAGIVTGALSDEEIDARSPHAPIALVTPGYNESLLRGAGFRLLDVEDRTASVIANATGRLGARHAHREELERLEGPPAFEEERLYLETVIALSRRGALSRMAYLAESAAG
jgi:SAM-dependent methyltransferase